MTIPRRSVARARGCSSRSRVQLSGFAICRADINKAVQDECCAGTNSGRGAVLRF